MSAGIKKTNKKINTYVDPYYKEKIRANKQSAYEHEKLIKNDLNYNKNKSNYYTQPIADPGSRDYELKIRGEAPVQEKLDGDPLYW